MSDFPSRIRVAISIVFVLLIAGSVQRMFGQGEPASVSGIVQDQQKAVIPGAEITLTQDSTGAVRSTVSNTSGYFSIVGIPAGAYTLLVGSPGFNKWQRTGLTLHPGDNITIRDVVLTIAPTADQVSVVASAATVIPVDTGEKAHVITANQIKDLSVIGRSAAELLKLIPGAVTTGDPGDPPGFVADFYGSIGEYSISGTRPYQTAATVDGANTVDPGCNCASAVTPNMDMVQEVKVQTANFTAETALGPVSFNAVTKSGTNEFHGEAYLYARHSIFNSRDWRSNFFDTKKPEDKFFFPGFNIGGPIDKGRQKLFFFAGFEYARQDHDLGVVPAVVPTEAMRRGDFSDGAYLSALAGGEVSDVPGNDLEGNSNDEGSPLTPNMLQGGIINPAFIDPGGQVLMNLYPLPNQDPATSAGFNYTSNILANQDRHQLLGRVDYNISDYTKLYTRFNWEHQRAPQPYILWWQEANSVPWPGDLVGKYNTYSSSTSLVNVLDPTATNEVVLAATLWSMPHTITKPEAVSKKALGFPYKGIFKNNITDIVPSYTNWGGGVADFYMPGGLDDPGIDGLKWLISLKDNFTKVAGTHTMKFGFYFEYVTNNEPPDVADNMVLEPTTWGGNSTGNAYADLLMGRIGEIEQSSRSFVIRDARREFTFFAQDSWKVSRRLTLEYGARFAHQGWVYEKKGRMFGFDPSMYDPNAPAGELTGLVSPVLKSDIPRSIFETPFLRVSPRFGFAYDLTGSGNTVIRGGAGVFKQVGLTDIAISMAKNPPLYYDTVICCALELKEFETMSPEQEGVKFNLGVAEPYARNAPTTYSWSFTLSHRLFENSVLEASYVGNASNHQRNFNGIGNLNAVPEGAMLGFPLGDNPDDYRPYQRYGNINMISYNLSQNYHSFQLTWNKQTGPINYALAYAFQKAMGVGGLRDGGFEGSAFDVRNRLYGVLPYDRTQTLSVSYSIMLPGRFRHPMAKAALAGWQVTGISTLQSGAPLGVGGNGAGGSFEFSGTLANGDEFSNINVTGTPDVGARPHLICDPRDGLASGQYMNPACFAAPTPGNNGVFRMPVMRGPMFQNHDISLFKNFILKEDKQMQFRFSMYNFLNHPIPFFQGGGTGLSMEFEDGVPTADSLAMFGYPDLKRGRRLMQFAFKFMF